MPAAAHQLTIEFYSIKNFKYKNDVATTLIKRAFEETKRKRFFKSE